MAHVIRDSFAFYSSISDLTANYWTASAALSLSSTITRFGVGQSLNVYIDQNTGQTCLKSPAYATNEETNFFVFSRFWPTTLPANTTLYDCLTWYDGATAQCSVNFLGNGNITVTSGAPSGTVLATFTGAWSPETWDQWQIKVIIHNTAGEVHIRKNGNGADDFSATGLDTRGGTANNYANQVAITTGTAFATGNVWYQDVWIYNGNMGSTPNDWIGDVRAVQIMPNADTVQKDFTNSITSSTLGRTAQVGSNTIALSANEVYTTVAHAPVGGGTFTGATLNLNAGATGHVIVALYDSDGAAGVPGTLLAISSPVTNPVSGTNAFTFSSPPTLQNQHKYYLAILSDVALTAKAGASGMRYTVSSSYSSGFPTPLGGTAGSGSDDEMLLSVSITPSNSGMLNEDIQDGGTSFVSDGTAGDYDLYTNPGFAVSPDSILGLSVRAFVAKSDAGARSGALTIKSGITTEDSSAQVLSTTFTNLVMVLDTDPSTGVAWTATGVGNLQFGPKVAA